MSTAIPLTTKRLNAVARKAPPNTVDAAARLLEVATKHRERASFVAHVLNAVAGVTDVADERALANPLSESSDYATLIQLLLNRPEILGALRQTDPLAPARLRGLLVRERLLAAEGGACSAGELARVLGITRQAVDKRRKNGTLIGLTLGKRGYAYPVWQISLQGLEAVLAELRGYDPWAQVAFMLNTNIWLDGETPLTALRRGDLDRVLEAARALGEQVSA